MTDPSGCGQAGAPVGDLVGRQHRVGEERAGAPGVVVAGVEDHPLAGAQREDRLADRSDESALADLEVQGARELGVLDRRAVGAEPQLEGHVEHHVAVGVLLEPAGAVAEAAVGGGEGAYAAEPAVPDPDAGDGLRDLLAVGADVLDRGRADVPGDAGEGLDARPAPLGRQRHERVPGLTRGDLDGGAGAGGLHVVVEVGLDAAGGDLDDRAREALVGDHHVAAAAEHEHRLAGGVGRAHRVDQLGLGLGPDPGPRRSAEPEGGVVAQIRHGRRPWARRAPWCPRRSPPARW